MLISYIAVLPVPAELRSLLSDVEKNCFQVKEVTQTLFGHADMRWQALAIAALQEVLVLVSLSRNCSHYGLVLCLYSVTAD